MELSAAIDKLVGYAVCRLALPARDAVYARNTLFMLTGAEGNAAGEYRGETLDELLASLEGALPPTLDAEKTIDAVMGALMLPPSAVEAEFRRRYEASPSAATEWLYGYSAAGGYIKMSAIGRNPRFRGKNGLIVTINLAKPEFRSPADARKENSVEGGYPACVICRENEGFWGRAKRTLRTVSFSLGGEPWFWQFSPYGYFSRHGIAVNARHVPMHVDEGTFLRLMEFTDLFPHYFIGCNAPIPRVGGSVLSHEHFQGGGERLPLFDAPMRQCLISETFAGVTAGTVDWPGTAIRVKGKDPRAIAAACEAVRRKWEVCTMNGLVPFDGEPHHAVSPTVLKTREGYEMNLILRSNLTSKEYPDGVYHAHPAFHAVKKESIGLIEAQGLFILPGRLMDELAQLKRAILCGQLPPRLSQFRLLFDEIMASAPKNGAEADEAIEAELASVCERILQNTAVLPPHGAAEFLKEVGFHD